MMMILSYRKSSRLKRVPMPTPNASHRSLISAFCPSLFDAAPRHLGSYLMGSSADFHGLRTLSDPPALSPSTMNSSVPSRFLAVQSVSLPGSRSFFVADLRASLFPDDGACALLRAKQGNLGLHLLILCPPLANCRNGPVRNFQPIAPLRSLQGDLLSAHKFGFANKAADQCTSTVIKSSRVMSLALRLLIRSP